MFKIKEFTLLELLIVIAIIGILVSLLVPSLAKARYAAKNTVCLSDQGQLAKSIISDANDKKGKFYAAYHTGNSPHDTGRSFVEDLEAAGLTTRNFMCVFRPQQYAGDSWLKGIFSVNRARLGYGYWVIRKSMANPDPDIWSSRYMDQNTSDHSLLSDTMFIRSGSTLFDEGWGTVHHGYNRQNQSMNKVYADGHGKIIHPASMDKVYKTHVWFYGEK